MLLAKKKTSQLTY